VDAFGMSPIGTRSRVDEQGDAHPLTVPEE
jgi:hypothetical protein